MGVGILSKNVILYSLLVELLENIGFVQVFKSSGPSLHMKGENKDENEN